MYFGRHSFHKRCTYMNIVWTLVARNGRRLIGNYCTGMADEDSGIDVANKEQYLADEDFLAIFEMNRETFEKLPKWRQVLLKKKVGVF